MDVNPLNWDHRRRANRPFHGLYDRPICFSYNPEIKKSSNVKSGKQKKAPTAFYLEQLYLSRNPTGLDPYMHTPDPYECNTKIRRFFRVFYLLLGRIGQFVAVVMLSVHWLLLTPLIFACRALAAIEWELFAVFALSVWLWSRADASHGMTGQEATRIVSELWKKERSLYSLYLEVNDLGKSRAGKHPGERLTSDSRGLLDPNFWGMRAAYEGWLTYEEVLRRSVPGRPTTSD